MYKPQDVSRRHKAPVSGPVPVPAPAPAPNETHRVESHSKPNRGQQRPPNVRFLGLIPHHSRHPTLHLFFTIFGSAVLLFLLFFLFPWKTQPDRQGWTFRQSIKHDVDYLKGSFSPSTSTVTTTTTLYQTVPTPLYTQEAVPEAKMSTEQTFIAIKPDGVQRGLVGAIISRFESRGFKLVAIKLVTPGKAHLEKHYADLADKPFFPGLIEYMNSGPIAAMVWEGLDAVKTGRTLLGATNPLASAPGTIRGDFALQTGRNVCHGSDSVENAKKEIALWFSEGDVVSWESAQAKWLYE
ncbi:nucleoside diphosphate kinase [Daldinia decipiens]|uniref:nucleoside diphosphate kinase n=1 Tax=Daldinia decipiens TaxID=326647 RepID=UPI0020C3B463|nr:nucleoside diphosphate kinase [Daldinia decipiens]KAI1658948.1 nucleoside diphosphate kinase [Daldinia decipiens]